MSAEKTFEVIIVGGGIAGLTSAIHLSQQGIEVLLIEKYEYPNHKVCGEYVSNEVLSYLKDLGVDPLLHGALPISNFLISDQKGNELTAALPLGGFGISRYAFDLLLYTHAKKQCSFVFDTVQHINFCDDHFTVITSTNEYKAHYVIGAFGKRSNLDKTLDRDFIDRKSPWLAVKAHYEFDLRKDTVALHNFEGGYCGLSKTETHAVNACYLTTYASFKKYGAIDDFQEKVLSENPYLNQFFKQAVPLFDKPLTISQISFQKKQPIKEHIFMVGDSAGLIHPLCGNGMAMAIHSAKLVSDLLSEAIKQHTVDRQTLEKKYKAAWQQTFANRLATGRRIQRLLQNPTATAFGFQIAQLFPAIVPAIIRKTHGNPIEV